MLNDPHRFNAGHLKAARRRIMSGWRLPGRLALCRLRYRWWSHSERSLAGAGCATSVYPMVEANYGRHFLATRRRRHDFGLTARRIRHRLKMGLVGAPRRAEPQSLPASAFDRGSHERADPLGVALVFWECCENDLPTWAPSPGHQRERNAVWPGLGITNSRDQHLNMRRTFEREHASRFQARPTQPADHRRPRRRDRRNEAPSQRYRGRQYRRERRQQMRALAVPLSILSPPPVG
jgi:hypothetical protein